MGQQKPTSPRHKRVAALLLNSTLRKSLFHTSSPNLNSLLYSFIQSSSLATGNLPSTWCKTWEDIPLVLSWLDKQNSYSYSDWLKHVTWVYDLCWSIIVNITTFFHWNHCQLHLYTCVVYWVIDKVMRKNIPHLRLKWKKKMWHLMWVLFSLANIIIIVVSMI